MKRTLGFGTEKFKTIFKEFDIFCASNSISTPIVTKQLISQWKSQLLNDSYKTTYGRFSIISQFCRYMCHLGYPCYVPKLPRYRSNTFIPYIFSHEQIHQIFAECDSLVMSTRNMRNILFLMPALLRLLYSTGLRISEAIALKNKDINFDKQYILIRTSKNKQQRLVSISPSMVHVLKQYIEAKKRLPLQMILQDDTPFFISPSGRSPTNYSIYDWFRVILKKCSIPYVGGNHGPRVHDLRHTFAVHSLSMQVKNGIDIYCALPVLSVFLGHKYIDSTESYVRLTQEIFPEIIDQEKRATPFDLFSYPQIIIDYEE
jgi:integrase